MAGLTVEQEIRVKLALADLHEACFTRDMKVTLVARHPTDGECHLVCGDDDLVEVTKLVRSKIPEDGEIVAKQYRREGKPNGTRESLAGCVSMLDTWLPECFPANEQGQVEFARGMMESVADEIRAFLATQPTQQE